MLPSKFAMYEPGPGLRCGKLPAVSRLGCPRTPVGPFQAPSCATLACEGVGQNLARFGPNTTKNFEDPSTPGVALGDDDIFFIDIGPIYEACEGDAGDTFAVGDDLEMTKAAEDVKSIWTGTRRRWLDDGLTGMALYYLPRRPRKTLVGNSTWS